MNSNDISEVWLRLFCPRSCYYCIIKSETSISGVKYINDCPIQSSVPVYLLVGGCCGVLRILATMWRNLQYRRQLDSYNDSYVHEGLYVSQTYRLMNVFLTLFLIGWLVAGSHWVFGVWEPPYSQPLHEPSNWCDRTVYRFAVYQIVGSYGFILLVVFVCCFLTIYYKACSWQFPIFVMFQPK